MVDSNRQDLEQPLLGARKMANETFTRADGMLEGRDEDVIGVSGMKESSLCNANDKVEKEGSLVKARGRSIRRAVRLILLGMMWVVFLGWIAMFLLYPTAMFREYIQEPLFEVTKSSYVQGGSSLLLFTAPILIVAILATIYLEMYEKDDERNRKLNKPSISLWTYPALVDHGLLGTISFAHLLLLALTLLYTLWFLWSFLRRDFTLVNQPTFLPTFKRWELRLDLAGLRLGLLGLILLGFLFLPISRGSILLRLIDIPFEHAVKYHVWLGHFMMAIFTAHGLTFLILWTVEGRLVSELLNWQKIGIANLPGVIALAAGWAMWVTSLHPVRQQFFELFFYTHQLYAVFLIFMALHIGDLVLGVAIGGIFLFLLDRFLRFCQSRRAVTVLSARVLPCDSIELVLAKPQSLKYNALSFIFLNVPGFSWLQWHPFSVSSSPYDSQGSVAVLIKPLGSWTLKLKDSVAAAEQHFQRKDGCPFGMRVSAEGPYGHESNYYLRYKNLILVAGGIGISPFVAILRDLLHRYKLNEADLPTSVLLIWAVKKSKELFILDLVHPASIYPDYATKLELDVQAYVTQELQPNLEVGQANVLSEATLKECTISMPMSVVVGTASNYWYCMCMVWCILGYIFIGALVGKYLVQSLDKGSYRVVAWSLRGGYVSLIMILAVVVFGGILVTLWSFYGEWIKSMRLRSKDLEELRQPFQNPEKEDLKHTEVEKTRLLQPRNTRYGTRPNFQELFQGASRQWEGSNVGVLVCGPQSLQSSVATECRNQNCKNLWQKRVAFHFHSLSFDL